MAYDDVILRMGEFGRYQRRIYLLLCLPAIICAFHKLAGVFLGPKVGVRRIMSTENPCNATFELPEDILNNVYQWDHSIKPIQACKFRSINETNTYYSRILDSGGNDTCKKFVYDTKTYHTTTTAEWDLVCDKAWLRTTGDSLFMVGVMLGSIIFGSLSDKYGRRPIFFLSLVIQLVGGILVAIAPEYISYVTLRLIVGSTTSGVFLVAYVIALEMVGPKKRLVAGVGCQLFFTTGYLITAGFAYLIRDWRTLQVVITLPSFVFLLYWWFIPESARWLLTKGKSEEAKDLLQKASKENGVEIPRETLNCLLNEHTDEKTGLAEKASLFDLFRHPNLRRKSILLFFNWLVNSGTYYGLSWQSSSLGGNDYMNFFFSGLVEVPAYTFLIFTLDRWGRKVILCGCMIISGVALLATVFVSDGLPRNTLVMIAKLSITSSYGAIYIFTAEQFPTVVRNVGLGASSTVARVGGVIAPYVNELSTYWAPLPFLFYGINVLIGGALSTLLPETLNKKLPETIEDGELFGKSFSKKEKIHKDVGQLGDVELLKPLKTIENGIYDSKHNG